MLRYFYLLCFLVCIEWTFCYDYINEENNYRPVRKLKKETRLRHKQHRMDHRARNLGSRRRQYEVEDRDPVAEIDVASFIQKPDYDVLDENSDFRMQHSNTRGTPKDYGDYGSHTFVAGQNMESNFPKALKDQSNLDNSLNFNLNPDLDNLVLKSRSQDKYFTEQISVHKPQKKCSMQKIKFPFFSHKDKVTAKPKKEKKKKSLTTEPQKQPQDRNLLKLRESKVNKVHNPMYKVKKRSYEERVCPLCKRKYIFNLNKDLSSSSNTGKLIHNSRQFYQDITDLVKSTTMAAFPKEADEPNKNLELKNENFDEDNTLTDDGRQKRDEKDFDLRDKERQLKELDKVQKKIDAENFDEDNTLIDDGRTKRDEKDFDLRDKERQLKELDEVQKKIDAVEISSPKIRSDAKY